MLQLLSRKTILVALIGGVTLFFFGYCISRDNEVDLFLTYSILTALFIYVFPFWKKETESKLNFKQILFIGIAFRLVLLFMTPNLSDDYFRFIWDGELMSKGQNPYEYKPVDQVFNTVKERATLTDKTFKGNNVFPSGMNSKKYYSVYPPVNQVIFGFATFFSGNSLGLNILILRLFIIGFDIGIILILAKLLKWFSKKKELIVLYALNPLVITELTGNLHFEGATLFFVLASMWFLLQKRTVQSGLLYALAICTKLIPLLLLPLFIFRMKWKQLFLFYGVIGIFTIVLFLPFLEVDLTKTFGSSISLYFKTFEFNASFYYLFREIGFYLYGYNKIEVIGKIGQVIVLLSVLIILIKSRKEMELKNVFKYFVWTLFIYYSVASIIHPWYVVYLLVFSVFTELRFPMIWSFTVVLSYYAYRDIGVVNENYWLLGIEYLVLFGAVVWDVYKSVRGASFSVPLSPNSNVTANA